MIRIRNIQINSDNLGLKDNQIVCFVGPNGAGKTRSLKAIHRLAHRQPADASHIKQLNIKSELDSVTAWEYFKNRIFISENRASWFGGQATFGINTNVQAYVQSALSDANFMNLVNLSFQVIDAKTRFEAIRPTDQIFLLESGPEKPLHLLYAFPDLEKHLGKMSLELFGKEVSLNPGAGSKLTLHVGPKPNSGSYGGDRTQRYANAVSMLPQIETEGDGIQATIGLLAALIEPNVEAFFVDEPDLYLHPPQAYAIGRIIVREKPSTQLFFSTHSSRFIQGLAEGAADRLLLVRLERENDTFSSRIIDVDIFSEIKSTPILRFANVIDSIFFKRTFVCEEASDCLFFSTSLERLGILDPANPAYWLGVSGKTNLAKTVKTLKALAVDPIVICDFDILNSEDKIYLRDLIPLIGSAGGDVHSFLELLEKRIYPQISANKSINWKALKLNGILAVSAYRQVYEDFELLLGELRRINIIVNPFGETESLCSPRVFGHGVEAINQILEIDIGNDTKLTNARNFCRVIGSHI